MTRCALLLLASSGLAWLPLPAARSGEMPPWAQEHDPQRMQMEQMADMEARGQLRPEQAAEVARYWATHLRRGQMNAIESAHYSIAELHLRAGSAARAIAALEKLLAATTREDLLSLTHLNLAELYRRQAGDAPKAAEHYQKVTGPLRHRAQAYLLAMLAETGKAEEAAKITEQLLAAAKEKGEKIALLQRLAGVLEQAKLPDKALAVYQRLATEFTPEDIEAIRQAAVQEVRDAGEQIQQFRQENNGPEVERLMRQIGRRADELRMAGRWDELGAFQEAVEKARREAFPPGPPRPPAPPAPDRPQAPQPPRPRDGEF